MEQTPEGSRVGTANQSLSFAEQTPEVTSLDGQEEASAGQEMDERLQSSGVNNAGSDMSVTLKWDNYNDLDLIVREPSGDLISSKRNVQEVKECWTKTPIQVPILGALSLWKI